jgi:peptidoglycan/xylan/chitin deacetylase (PgdA/CDA1 family)
VLFTFDDGPHPDGTVQVLEVLRRYRARAVFFVIGARIDRAPFLLQRILDEGHLLGNHSYSHDRDVGFGFARYQADLQRCQDSIQWLTGVRPTLFRPPLGQLTLRSVIASRALGLRSVFWSVDSGDWRLRSDDHVTPCAERLENALSGPGLQEIVLMHDERTYTAMVLDRTLRMLVERGIDVRSGVDAI